IVRGTTSREIVQMARDCGANKVYFASAAPPVRFPNVYGIDMPTRQELLATGRSDAEIALEIGADAVFYQDLEDLVRDVGGHDLGIECFDASCFDGKYITGDITPEYLADIEAHRCDGETRSGNESTQQLDLNLSAVESA
ncbi:MAG: amidophosphoribosyltransferase, partial [Ferrovum sp.]|nr:amidophosphoribosyltransferase [Ferrovum sp.]